jgi:gas vesicle protein
MTDERIYYSHEAEMHAMRNRTVLALVLLTCGLGIGAALALLFAPSSGKTTRHDLRKGVEEGLNTGRDAVEPVVKRVEKELDGLKKNVEEHMK